MSLTAKPIIGQRPFVMSPYLADAQGVLRPARPRSCSAATDLLRCHHHIERWRMRKRGPPFPLCSLYCLIHDVSFTAYPPGWPPYSRTPIIDLDHFGRMVSPESEAERWCGSIFTAVAEAASGAVWPEVVFLGPSASEDATGLQPCKRTQRRHIAGAMRLFALDSVATRREREQVNITMNLDMTILEAASGRIRDGPSLLVRGEEGAKVLRQLPAVVLTMSGLLTLGTSRGFWGPVLS